MNGYIEDLRRAINNINYEKVEKLIDYIKCARSKGNWLYIIGNGGSAANANHIANDMIYGANKNVEDSKKLKCAALTSNVAIVTCFANDNGFENIFSSQLDAIAEDGDILLVLSGSGNSPNLVKAIQKSKEKSMRSIGILGFDGGKCKSLVDMAILVGVNDMQVSEDMQLVVGHMCMKALCEE